jgi:hypothetical protein
MRIRNCLKMNHLPFEEERGEGTATSDLHAHVTGPKPVIPRAIYQLTVEGRKIFALLSNIQDSQMAMYQICFFKGNFGGSETSWHEDT